MTTTTTAHNMTKTLAAAGVMGGIIYAVLKHKTTGATILYAAVLGIVGGFVGSIIDKNNVS